jgi:hypothetical protein
MENQLPLFYKKVVPLTKNMHQKLYITPIKNYNHTRDTNSLYIAVFEFLQASREYPIVFGTGSDKSIYPLVILGLKNNENLYVGKKGEWLAKYIPAYVRRYPFILATDNKISDKYAVCIDEDYPGLNEKEKGIRLYGEDGSESPLLKQSINFLKEYQRMIQQTDIFCNKINRLNLLEPMHVTMEKAGKKQTLGGFMCINRKQLKDLSPDELVTMVRNDYLEMIYAHLHSLANIDNLINRVK